MPGKEGRPMDGAALFFIEALCVTLESVLIPISNQRLLFVILSAVKNLSF
jgi:hypothetical protein